MRFTKYVLIALSILTLHILNGVYAADSTSASAPSTIPTSKDPFVLYKMYVNFTSNSTGNPILQNGTSSVLCPSNYDYYFELTPANTQVTYPGSYPICINAAYGPDNGTSSMYRMQYTVNNTYNNFGSAVGSASSFLWTVWCYPNGKIQGAPYSNPGGVSHTLNSCTTTIAGYSAPRTYIDSGDPGSPYCDNCRLYTNKRCPPGTTPQILLTVYEADESHGQPGAWNASVVSGPVNATLFGVVPVYSFDVYTEKYAGSGWHHNDVHFRWQLYCQ